MIHNTNKSVNIYFKSCIFPSLLVDWHQLACNWLIPTWSVLKVTKAVEGNSWLDKADCPVIASRLPKSKHELDGYSGYLSCFDLTYLSLGKKVTWVTIFFDHASHEVILKNHTISTVWPIDMLDVYFNIPPGDHPIGIHISPSTLFGSSWLMGPPKLTCRSPGAIPPSGVPGTDEIYPMVMEVGWWLR